MDDYVTSGEFGRWRTDFQMFQDRLETRLDHGFTEIKEIVAGVETQTQINAAAIVRLDERVTNIKDQGCAQYQHHKQALAKISGPPARNRVKTVGFIGGASALIADALYRVWEHFHQVLK